MEQEGRRMQFQLFVFLKKVDIDFRIQIVTQFFYKIGNVLVDYMKSLDLCNMLLNYFASLIEKEVKAFF